LKKARSAFFSVLFIAAVVIISTIAISRFSSAPSTKMILNDLMGELGTTVSNIMVIGKFIEGDTATIRIQYDLKLSEKDSKVEQVTMLYNKCAAGWKWQNENLI
jgi:hypothetical protein